jgi:transposase-like protein
MAQNSPIRRKKVTKEDDLTQEMISQILLLHESGVAPKAIQLNLHETCHANVSSRLINRTTDKMDCLVEDWLKRLKGSIGEEYGGTALPC